MDCSDWRAGLMSDTEVIEEWKNLPVDRPLNFSPNDSVIGIRRFAGMTRNGLLLAYCPEIPPQDTSAAEF